MDFYPLGWHTGSFCFRSWSVSLSPPFTAILYCEWRNRKSFIWQTNNQKLERTQRTTKEIDYSAMVMKFLFHYIWQCFISWIKKCNHCKHSKDPVWLMSEFHDKMSSVFENGFLSTHTQIFPLSLICAIPSDMKWISIKLEMINYSPACLIHHLTALFLLQANIDSSL